jgi:kinesin family protein 18/19
MIGTQTDPGIMVSVMEDLFVHSLHQGRQQGVQHKVSVSFLEVYNENIRDLLSDVEEYLDLREDPIKGPVVASITEIEATSGQEIMQLLHQGNAKRSQAATAANEVSSRSHAVLQVVVECRDRAPGTVANIKVGKLSLVDLAGSERAANTKNVGQRLVEGANINRSLLALGNCINALGEKGNKGNFVPYRDSKLTRLLKDSLGGNCRTVMIANISSAESSFEETLNTLKYANRAKNIKTNVQRNVLNVNYHISEYVELINNLRSEIQVLKNQISSGNSVERVATSHFSREMGLANAIISSPGGPSIGQAAHLGGPSTPFQALRESLRSGAAGEGREIVNNMRQRIVDNFQEKMQLRRSLIELEDQNVQNSIEVSKRQLLIVQWSEKHGNFLKKNGISSLTKSDFAAYILANGSPEIIEAWQECEQLRKAIIKNNGMKKNIAKRLRHNEKDAEKFREDLVTNVTGEDRRELMALQYQVGRLELENMELEQHRIVHESILKGKDLIIQKLKLQLAVRNKLINRQQVVLKEHNLDAKVGYDQLTLMEETLMGDMELGSTMAPPSPPRNMADILTPDISQEALGRKFISDRPIPIDKISLSTEKPVVPHLRISEPIARHTSDEDEIEDEYEMAFTEREIALTARDRDMIEQGEWSEIQSELSDQSFSLGNRDMNSHHKRREKEFRKEPQTDGKKLSFSKESKVVNGPRGGRMYRASLNSDEGALKKLEEKPAMGKFSKAPSQFQNEEFSDEEVVPNSGIQGKYRHYASPRVKDAKSMATGTSEKAEQMPIIYPTLEENAPNSRKTDKDSTPRSIFDNGNNRGGKEKEKVKELRPIAAIFPRKDDRVGKQFEEDAADVLFSDNNDFDLVVKSKPLGKGQGKLLKSKASAPELPSKGSSHELPTVSGNLDVVASLADLAINGDGVSGGRQVNRAKGIRQTKHSTKGAIIAPMENSIETDPVDDGPLGVRIKSLPVLNKHPSGSLPNSARDNLPLQRS